MTFRQAFMGERLVLFQENETNYLFTIYNTALGAAINSLNKKTGLIVDFPQD